MRTLLLMRVTAAGLLSKACTPVARASWQASCCASKVRAVLQRWTVLLKRRVSGPTTFALHSMACCSERRAAVLGEERWLCTASVGELVRPGEPPSNPRSHAKSSGRFRLLGSSDHHDKAASGSIEHLFRLVASALSNLFCHRCSAESLARLGRLHLTMKPLGWDERPIL